MKKITNTQIRVDLGIQSVMKQKHWIENKRTVKHMGGRDPTSKKRGKAQRIWDNLNAGILKKGKLTWWVKQARWKAKKKYKGIEKNGILIRKKYDQLSRHENAILKNGGVERLENCFF